MDRLEINLSGAFLLQKKETGKWLYSSATVISLSEL